MSKQQGRRGRVFFFGLFGVLAILVLYILSPYLSVIAMALIFLLTGNLSSAIIILIGFYVFVNPTDLILRPKLVSKEAYLNFALMLLALFGGLAVGGILGMIYGPVIMILFITTIDIFAEYFAEPKEDPVRTKLEVIEAEGLADGQAGTS